MKRLIPLFLFLPFAFSLTDASSQCVSYQVKVCIDGEDYLHIKGNKMWWQHVAFQNPGQHSSCLSYGVSIEVNGTIWTPWDSAFSIANITGDSLIVTVITCYNSCHLIQYPDSANGWETIYDFDDKNPGGPHLYDVLFTFCKTVQPPLCSFLPTDTTICAEGGGCINFSDHSTGNPTSWKWFFPGAMPDSSVQQNPANICYFNPGTYAVTLIVANGGGSDTLAISPMVIVGNTPPAPIISVIGGDTLVCSPAASYQWFFNGIPIPGATDSFFVEHNDGLYNVSITDSLGCSRLGTNVLINAVTEMASAEASVVKPTLSPANDLVTFSKPITSARLVDASGRQIPLTLLADRKSATLPPIPKGIYIITLFEGEKSLRQKLLIK